MKRFLIFLFLLFVVSACSFGESFLQSVLKEVSKIEVTAPASLSAESFYYIEDISSLKSYEALKLELSSEDAERILNKVSVIEKQSLGSKTIIYGFVEGYYKYYYLSGKKANIMLVFEENKATVGLPLILSGF